MDGLKRDDGKVEEEGGCVCVERAEGEEELEGVLYAESKDGLACDSGDRNGGGAEKGREEGEDVSEDDRRGGANGCSS